MSNLLSELKSREKKLLKAKEKLDNDKTVFPKGTLKISMQGKNARFYLCMSGKSPIYVSKKENELVHLLAQKEYKIHLKNAVEMELRQVQHMLKNYRGDAENVYDRMLPARKELITPYMMTDELFIEKWAAAPITGPVNTFEKPELYTARGEMVRSKSEVMIADRLYMKGIPYRYEQPLKLKNGTVLYPDFTILSKRTLQEYVFEHFGMMDDPEYASKAVEKITNYQRNGYFAGKNLLITFETSDTPLNTKVIDGLIQSFLV